MVGLGSIKKTENMVDLMKENTHMPGLGGQTRNHLLPTHVISKSPNSVALGVPLLARTRRAGPEKWFRGTCLPFLHSPMMTQIPDTDMLHSLYQTQYK